MRVQPPRGVLFCGALEKKKAYGSHNRFVCLTASQLHWFKRPQEAELFGEPRGSIHLENILSVTIVDLEIHMKFTSDEENNSSSSLVVTGGRSSADLMLSPTPTHRSLAPTVSSTGSLGSLAPFKEQPTQPQEPPPVYFGPHISPSLSRRRRSIAQLSNRASSMFFSHHNKVGVKVFIAPTASAAFAWRSAIELAVERWTNSDVESVESQMCMTYHDEELDGYGEEAFINALGEKMEAEEEEAGSRRSPRSPRTPCRLGRSTRSPTRGSRPTINTSPPDKDNSRGVAVATFNGRVVMRGAKFGVLRSSSSSSSSLVECDDPEERGLLAVTLLSGETAMLTGGQGEFDIELRGETDGDATPRKRLLRVKLEALPTPKMSMTIPGFLALCCLAFSFTWGLLSEGLALVFAVALLWRSRTSKVSLTVLGEVGVDTAVFFSEECGSPRSPGPSSNGSDDELQPGETVAAAQRRRRRVPRLANIPNNNEEEFSDEIDPKFVSGAAGNLKLARDHWEATKKWRKAGKVGSVLSEPQPHFEAIKEHYPHWLGGRAKEGELVYWERIGKVDAEALKKAGVTLESLLRHYIFVNEWTWEVLSPKRSGEASFQFVIIDVEGVKLSQIGGMRLEYLKACSDIAQRHYPDRTKKYLIINAPGWFSAVWRVVKPLLNVETQQKVVVSRPGENTTKTLLTYMDACHVPACFGGDFAPGESIDQARRKTPEELACAAHVLKHNVRSRQPSGSEDGHHARFVASLDDADDDKVSSPPKGLPHVSSQVSTSSSASSFSESNSKTNLSHDNH